uniref:Uncharacterized protein n=1 Tax=Eptatretus burgeri TaxID=7764 RepID=A0A8C4R361_EPTBU
MDGGKQLVMGYWVTKSDFMFSFFFLNGTPGKPLRLICQARYTIAGMLKPLVWWLIDRNFSTDSHITGITEDNDSTIVNKTGGYETVEQGLNIIKVEQIHLSVNFTCIALNGRGFTSGSVSLYENNDTRKTDREGSWKYRDQVKKTWIWEVVGTISTLITLFTLGYALRFDIILFYRHYLAQEPPPDGKRFDACIVTALDATQAELNFALQELPEALEKRLCYSLWINARNANSCQYMEGLRSALSLSRRLIVVLGPHCVIKSNMSHHGIDAILNTVLDKGNPPSLMIFVCPLPRGTAHSLIKRPILQRAFKELPVLCWEEEKPMLCSSFWSRLHCFLPHQRTSAQKQDWQQFGDEE